MISAVMTQRLRVGEKALFLRGLCFFHIVSGRNENRLTTYEVGVTEFTLGDIQEPNKFAHKMFFY